MPDLLAVRFSKVGFYDTRIDGLGYDLSRDGEARNSLVITGNGGGKTTQIHLLFSLFLPQKYDLMTYRDNTGRRFEYYFEENEIAFIAAEWSIPNTQVSLGGKPRTRVIGRFTQFTNREKYEHETCFFSFIADDSLGIDDLPITSSIPHRVRNYCRTMSEAKKFLKETFDRPGREFFGPSVKMEEWQNHLRSLGFNIDIFRLMQMFTMSEGDPAAFLNRYCNNEAVLGLITKEVMDKASTTRLRDMLVQHRESIRLAPTTRAQIAAYNALHELFSQMEPIARNLTAAEEEHRKAQEGLGVVAGRVRSTLEAANERVSALSERQAGERQVLAEERRRLSDLQAELRGVERRLAEIAVLEAKERHRDAVNLHKEKDLLARAIRALVDRVAVTEAQAVRDDLARWLDALAEPTRSLADEAAMAEALLAEHLEKDLSTASGLLQKLEREHKETAAQRQGLAEKQQGLRAELGGVRREEQLLAADEATREASLAELARFAPSGKEDSEPQQLLLLLEEERAELNQQKDTAQQELQAARSELNATEIRLETEGQTLERRQGEAAAAAARHEEYLRKNKALTELPGILNAFKLEAPDPFRPGLDARLKTTMVECETDIRVLQGEIAAREERIAAIGKNGGLLPSSDDVERVLEALRAEKVDAYSYWQVFSQQNRSAEESAAALRMAPLRVGGVAVSGTRSVERAREILENFSVLAPVAVSDYATEIFPQQEAGLVVFPDAALAIDREKAQQYCSTAGKEIAEKERSKSRVTEARMAADEARDALLGFLGTFNSTAADDLGEEMERTRRNVAASEAGMELLAEKRDALATRESAAMETVLGLDCAIDKIEPGIAAVSIHIAKYEDGREERLQKLLQLSRDRGNLEHSLEALAEELFVAEVRAKSVQESAIKADHAVMGIKNELAELTGAGKSCTDAFRMLATTTESARTLRLEKLRALESANANEEYLNAKAQYEAAAMTHKTLLKGWEDQHDKVPAERLALAQSTAVAGDRAMEEDYMLAMERKEEAFREEVRAEQARDAAADRDSRLREAHLKVPVTPCMLALPEAIRKEETLSSTAQALAVTADSREREMEARAKELDRATGEVSLFRALAADLQLPDDGREYPTFAGVEEAQDALLRTRDSEKHARQTADTLRTELHRLNIKLGELLDGDGCRSISAMGSLIKEEQRRCEGLLKDDIGGFLSRISNAVDSLRFELGQHEENERKVIEQVALDVKKAHGYLKKLENRSKVPALGGIWAQWSGRSFIRFQSKVEIDSELSRQVIVETVSTISQLAGELPPGDQIILTALCNVLDKRYTIETLKPDSSPTTRYRSIEHATGLNSWSGGERLSGAVLFYLAICNLLTVEGQTGNVMLLDNPFGSCTNIDFIRLVLALARQYGVQVVAFTPTEVEDIRRLFPLNIMIRKGGADGIVKKTGRPLVRYEKTVYNEGETAVLEMPREVPSHVPA